MIETLETLIKLRNLMENFWCRGSMAINKYGFTCGPKDPEAIKFCLIGGIHNVSTSPEDTKELYDIIGTELRKREYHDYIVLFNDEATHREIINLLDSCIQNHSKQEQV